MPTDEEQVVRKVVYLTFDDGPCARTPELLEMLKREEVHATFFLVGRSLTDFPDEVRAIREGGHAIGSHSFYHNKKALSTQIGFLRDRERFQEKLSEVFGEPTEVRLFRFPFGSGWTTSQTRRFASDCGYLWIDWNASSDDTKPNMGVQKQMEAALRTSRNKNEIVLLMHENKAPTISMLPELLQSYRDAGYVFDVLAPDLGRMIPGVRMGLPSEQREP